MSYVVGEGGVVSVNPGDAPGDIAIFINEVLADPAVTRVHLGEGVFVVSSAIVVPSGKTLEGAGRDLTWIQAAPDFEPISPQHNGVVNSGWGAIGVTLTDFAVDAGKVLPGGIRINGVMMKQATGFTVERVDVSNATGYAHYAQGDLDGQTVYASGTYVDCQTFNSQVHFEQMYCDGVTLTNCHARDGDNDISTEAYFHPLAGSKNITFVDCTAYGNGFIGFSLVGVVSTGQLLENITIINCEVEIVREQSGFGLVAINGPTQGLHIVDSTFVSRNYIAMSIAGTSGTASGSEFRGGVIAVEAGPHWYQDTPNSFVFTDSVAVGVSSPTGARGIYGVANYGTADSIVWEGGSIEALGANGYMYALSGPVQTSATTELETGYAGAPVYVEDALPLPMTLGAVVDGLGTVDFAGGTLTLRLLNEVQPADTLLFTFGEATGSLALENGLLSYDGAAVGTVQISADGRTIDVAFEVGATAAAISAVVASLSFATTGDEPTTGYRPVMLVLTDVGGQEYETAFAVQVELGPGVYLGTPGDDSIVGWNSGDTFELQQGGADSAIGGRGQDIFHFGAAFTGDDQVDGGGGNDFIRLQGDYAGARRTTLGGVSGVELILLVAGNDTRYGDPGTGRYSYDITAADLNVASGASLTIEGRTLRIGEKLLFDGSAETSGAFKVFGGAGDDTLTGGAGNDVLDGSLGTDTLAGGAGNDTYYVDSYDYIVGEGVGAGSDFVYTRTSFGLRAGAEIEQLGTTDQLSLAALTLLGNEFNNSIIGNNGNNALYGGAGDDSIRGLEGRDLLDGQAGTDYLIGGAGDDRYFVDGLDSAVEATGEGYDTVYARTSYTLNTSSEVEMLATTDYTSTIALSLSGNQLNNNIVGNNGNNTLDGRAGDDSLRGLAGNDLLIGGTGVDYMIGGTGNDNYYVDTGDTVVELAGEGGDAVYASASYVLTAGSSVELLGTLDYRSTVALDLTGNDVGQSIVGTFGANTLLGLGGTDSMNGLDGDDRLDGGAGQDYLQGGAGADTFRFTAAGHSAMGAADTIADFVSGSDRVDLSAIDADTSNPGEDAFTFVGATAFSGTAGELRVQGDAGTFNVYGDTDGNGLADFHIVVNSTDLVSGDFYL